MQNQNGNLNETLAQKFKNLPRPEARGTKGPCSIVSRTVAFTATIHVFSPAPLPLDSRQHWPTHPRAPFPHDDVVLDFATHGLGSGTYGSEMRLAPTSDFNPGLLKARRIETKSAFALSSSSSSSSEEVVADVVVVAIVAVDDQV